MNRLKLAFRTLTKTPFITAVAILSLALGIGANAAIFSLFDQILLRPLPVPQPERLVNFGAPGPKQGSSSCGGAGSCEEIFSYPMFKDLRAVDSGFADIAAHVSFGANIAVDGRTRSGEGMLISGSYFPTLRLQPELGRLLGHADDETIGGHFVAVLSYGYWSRELGEDPGVLNQTIVINGQSMTIVGVAPRGFWGTSLTSRPDVFVPMSMRELLGPYQNSLENRQAYWAYLFGRLDEGVELETAAAELNAVYSGIINEVDAPLADALSEQRMQEFRAKQLVFTPGYRGQSNLHGDAQAPLAMLFALTGTVLLIACANVANLLLARGATRDTEMAIRASLGASRRQLLGQLLLESCLLALLGGAASLLVARWTLGGIMALMPGEVSEILDPAISLPVIGFAAALSLATGLIFGLYPALHSTRSDLVTTLRESSGQPSGARSASRFRAGMVVVQLALSMCLLVAAGLFIRSLVNVSRVDLGLETDNVVTFGISPQLNGYEAEESRELFMRAEQELAAIPGVRSATTGLVPVIAGSNWGNNVSVEGYERGPDIDSNSRYNEIGPGYFATLGIPLLAGREFRDSDGPDDPGVVIVNETFTRKFNLDGRNALGKRMAIGATDDLNLEIVGVVADAKYSDVKQETPPLMFVPYRQTDRGFLNFYLRTEGDPDTVLRAIPDVMARLDPNLPVEDLKTLAVQVRENVFEDRLISTLASSFAVLATILAAIGLYGVLAFMVAQRTREIGVRMALGADAGKVRLMVLRQVAKMAAIGSALGLLGAFVVGRGAESLLFGLDGTDPLVIVAAIVGLGLVALAAAYIPALRASRVDPMKALRFE